jgi:hypothetical protein
VFAVILSERSGRPSVSLAPPTRPSITAACVADLLTLRIAQRVDARGTMCGRQSLRRTRMDIA